MEFTQTTHATLSLSIWVAAQALLLRLTWPLAAKLDDRDCAGARLHFALALSGFCVLAGALAAVFTGSRLLIAIAPGVPAAAFFRLGRGSAAHGPDRPAERWLLGGLALFSAAGAIGGFRAPLFPYDGLLYHLPTSALAWQQRTIFVMAAHPQIGANPVLPELAKTWAFAISGDDSLAALQQLPAIVALAALAFALARRWGAHGVAALGAAAAVLLTPKAFEQAFSPDVDLLAALAGATAAVLLARRHRRIAAGALITMAQLKYTTFLPGLAGAALLFLRLARESAGKAAAWAAVFTAAGGFWEWRNLAKFGNPTRPYQLLASPGALSRLLPGWIVDHVNPAKWSGYYLNGVEAAAGSAHVPAPWRHFLAWGDVLFVPYDAYGGRWGPAWFVLAVPALALLLAVRRRRAPRDLLFAILFYAFTVKSWEARFGLLLLPFGFAGAAWAVSRSGRALGARWLAPALFAPLLLWNATQIAFSHPHPALRRDPGASPLALATRDPAATGVSEMASQIDRLAPRSLWIDFTVGERHYYGMATSLLYPFFSPRWDREITISATDSIGIFKAEEEITRTSPAALLLQAGSPLNGERLGYHRVFVGSFGRLYAK